MDNKLRLELTNRQSLAFCTMEDDKVQDVLYGGAKGGGKSVFFCAWVYAYCLWIANMFNLPESEVPPHVGWMGRKQSVDFTATTLETWKEWIPQDEYKIKGGTEKSSRHILLWNRIAVDYGGLDRTDSINKFNSAEYGFIALDQAEETSRDEVAVLRASRRLKINGKHLPYKGLFTANPAKCWLKDEFITAPQPNYRFIKALPADNPYLPDSYIDTLKDAFRHRPELLAAYLDGSWEIADDACQVIKSIWIAQAIERDVNKYNIDNLRRILTCDVARYGDNETVIYDMLETDILEAVIYGQKNTTHTTNHLAKMSGDRGGILVVVDEGGVGGGVVDGLEDLRVPVLAINSSSASDVKNPKTEKPMYYNKRAEIWDNAAKMFQNGDVELHWEDEQLKAQLTVPTYEYRNSKILIESKDNIKERLGRSPDRADAYVNGLYGLRFTQPKGYKPKSNRPAYAKLGIG